MRKQKEVKAIKIGKDKKKYYHLEIIMNLYPENQENQQKTKNSVKQQSIKITTGWKM